MTSIFQSKRPVTIVGGGDVGPEDLNYALSIAPTCVAADGGSIVALAAGIELEAVIGDFDSLDASVLAQVHVERQHHISEQNSTDFDKCLRNVDTPVVVGVGFLGGRVDHQMAAMHTLVVRADRPCVLLGPHEVVFHCPAQMELPTCAGDIVSLFPMSEVAGTSTGLEWPIDGLALAPGQRVGTSNCATGAIALTMTGPGMLCILPRRMLKDVTQLLASLPDHVKWPARAG